MKAHEKDVELATRIARYTGKRASDGEKPGICEVCEIESSEIHDTCDICGRGFCLSCQNDTFEGFCSDCEDDEVD